MGTSSSTLVGFLLVAVIGLIVGLAAGYLIAGLRNEEQKEDRQTSQDDDAEGVHILRERKTGVLSIKIDGQLYQRGGDLTVNRHNRLVRLLAEVRKWMGTVESAILSPDETVAPETMSQSGMPPDSGSEAAPVEKPGSPSVAPPIADEQDKPVQPGSFEWLGQMLSRKRTQDVPEKSIAAQIDEILQEKLLDSPLAERAIRLMELPDKGMVVLVGLDKYDSVDDVPDEDVRQLLKDCVSEWESSKGGK